ncbi:A/G-specific adenine glycosylase [Gulosibacter sp. GYB002]|uniref:A/G-specific adenine glycosylase n=1 Tax=Gulosibacter sp. GYB002 TaxID=2994391 RepID=UPI002F966280
MTDNPLVTAVIDWYRFDHRDFPWRDPDVTPWGILVSEVMSHQTQMSRVTSRWLEFMRRWPTPAAAAQASDAEILRVWDRLGYPRRALALRQCAVAIVERHDGEIPADREALQALPGIGPYTSAAVCSFAFGMRVPVVDTNVRRVIARAVHGDEVAWRPNARRDEAEMLALLPRVDADVQPWNAGAMELGATVCTQRSPDCVRCPIAEICEWRGAGFPSLPDAERERRKLRQPKFAGSNRQRRGRVMAIARGSHGGFAIDQLWNRILLETDFCAPEDSVQLAREREQHLAAATTLIAEGMLQQRGDWISLPGEPAS